MTIVQIILMLIVLSSKIEPMAVQVPQPHNSVVTEEASKSLDQLKAESFINGCVIGGIGQTYAMYQTATGEELTLTEKDFNSLSHSLKKNCIQFLVNNAKDFGINPEKVDFSLL